MLKPQKYSILYVIFTYPHAGLLPEDFASLGFPLALSCVLCMEALVALVALVAGSGLFSSPNG